MIAYITIGSPLILLGKPHQFFNVFEITRTNGSLILILFLPTNWNWQVFVNSNNYTTPFWTSCHRYISHCTQNCAQPQPLPLLRGFKCSWNCACEVVNLSCDSPHKCGQGLQDLECNQWVMPPQWALVAHLAYVPAPSTLIPCLQVTTAPPHQLLQRSTKRYQTWSQSFHSHLAHFSCLNQGSAVISNSTKPLLGVRAIFKDDDHSSQKIKYMVPIYNHSYHKVKYPVLISNHDYQFLGFRVLG